MKFEIFDRPAPNIDLTSAASAFGAVLVCASFLCQPTFDLTWALAGCAIIVACVLALRTALAAWQRSFRVSSILLGVFVFVYCVAQINYVLAGYPPLTIADATIPDILLFPYVVATCVGLIVVWYARAYVRRPAEMPSPELDRTLWMPIAAVPVSAVLALVAACVVSLSGIGSIGLGPLVSARLSRAQDGLRAGMTTAEVCAAEPFRRACGSSASDDLQLQYSDFGMFCYSGGRKLTVHFKNGRVASWKVAGAGTGC